MPLLHEQRVEWQVVYFDTSGGRSILDARRRQLELTNVNMQP
jgi:hypothetical protein